MTRKPLHERAGVRLDESKDYILVEVCHAILDRIESLESTAGDTEHLRRRVTDLERMVDELEKRPAVSAEAARVAEHAVPIGGKPWEVRQTGPLTVDWTKPADLSMLGAGQWHPAHAQPPQDAPGASTPATETVGEESAPQAQPRSARADRRVPRYPDPPPGCTVVEFDGPIYVPVPQDFHVPPPQPLAVADDEATEMARAAAGTISSLDSGVWCESLARDIREYAAGELERMAEKFGLSGAVALQKRAAELRGKP